jgi:flagellar hook-associated protein 2
MSTSITAPTYDPVTTATTMAQKATASAQQLITDQTNAASATAKALTTLGNALSAFRTSLASLTSSKPLLAQSAALSDTTVGSASAKPGTAAGTYSLFVQQLATASQVAYALPDAFTDNQPPGQLSITLSATDPGRSGTPAPAITIDMAALDTDHDGKVSARDLADAINKSSGNNGKLTASVATVNGVSQLVLTAANTGKDNAIWMSSSLETDIDGDGTPDPGYALGARTELVAAKNAQIYLGGKTGILSDQPTNTFTGIDGVTFTATRAQDPAKDDAFTIKVGSDTSATTANVQAFVDAYNKLKAAVDAAVDPGDPASGKGAGAFAHDAGVKALQSRLVGMLRTGGASGSPSLAGYGIVANRDGSLTLNTTRLAKQLAADPKGLDQLIGSASLSAPTGIAGALDKYLDLWNNATKGQIQQRTDATKKLQTTLTKRQDALQTQYDAAYNRYLKQFTELQTLQSAMNSNVSMFDALFGNQKS